MLEIKQLSVEGKNHASLLKSISFSVELGQHIGLTGASGAGKTTLIKAIMGILDATCCITNGDILLDGVSLPAMRSGKRRALCGTTIGFIPQNPMTAFDRNIRIGSLMKETFRLRLGCFGAEATHLAEEALLRVNLHDTKRILNSSQSQLSGGMLQRITMAMLWALKPKYILADEPTSALDEANRDLLIGLFKNYLDKCGIIFLSHDAVALKSLCEQIMVMEKGALVEKASTGALFQNPAAEWTKKFVAFSKSKGEDDWEWTA